MPSSKASSQQPLQIGVVGGGTIAGGVCEILMGGLQLPHLSRPVHITKTCVKELSKPRSFHFSEASSLVTDINSILNDDSIGVVVEVMGGTSVAKTVTLEAIKEDKSVVTANKELIAKHSQDIQNAMTPHPSSQFSYKASVCGGIPIIQVLQSACTDAALRFSAPRALLHLFCRTVQINELSPSTLMKDLMPLLFNLLVSRSLRAIANRVQQQQQEQSIARFVKLEAISTTHRQCDGSCAPLIPSTRLPSRTADPIPRNLCSFPDDRCCPGILVVATGDGACVVVSNRCKNPVVCSWSIPRNPVGSSVESWKSGLIPDTASVRPVSLAGSITTPE